MYKIYLFLYTFKQLRNTGTTLSSSKCTKQNTISSSNKKHSPSQHYAISDSTRNVLSSIFRISTDHQQVWYHARMSNNPPTTTQPATSDDDRFVRISVKELREYIARSRELNQLRLRLNMADYTTESNVLVSQSIQSVQAVDPAQAIHPRPQAGGVQPATSLLEQALSINAMPPPTAKFTNSEGITRDLEIPRSKVPYKDIISNVIEFIKLQSQDDRRRLFLPGDT